MLNIDFPIFLQIKVDLDSAGLSDIRMVVVPLFGSSSGSLQFSHHGQRTLIHVGLNCSQLLLVVLWQAILLCSHHNDLQCLMKLNIITVLKLMSLVFLSPLAATNPQISSQLTADVRKLSCQKC